MESSDPVFRQFDKNSKACSWFRNFVRNQNLSATPPKAVLIISAHWEASPVQVTSSEQPSLLYDYYGFPDHTYQLKYPVPGSPKLATRVQSLLATSGIRCSMNSSRGLDHGVFVPMLLAYPDATIPIVQLSLDSSLDPRTHLAIGRALSPLRDEGVLIFGSGFITHDLSFRLSAAESTLFTDALEQALSVNSSARDDALMRWTELPHARKAHPREEHLLPLLVCAGVADNESKFARIGHDLSPPPWLFDCYRID